VNVEYLMRGVVQVELKILDVTTGTRLYNKVVETFRSDREVPRKYHKINDRPPRPVLIQKEFSLLVLGRPAFLGL
jgi:hypothetical protein